MTLLTRSEPTLPGAWYYEPAQYERELEAVWYRDWICVGRNEDLPAIGDYVTTSVGHERLIVTRAADGAIRAFHNTCRHRGSRLVTGPHGRFASRRIVCPYHAWTYSLDGDLLATPVRTDTADFRPQNHGLYAVHAATWGGFVFVNLSATPEQDLDAALGPEAANVASWPLADLVSVHRETSTVACNWKVFWENYSECYHCPGVHPELCRVVPLYQEGLLSYADRPDERATRADPRPHVAPGIATWTLDGRSTLPALAGPDPHLAALGMVFASFTPHLYVVAHPDYVRSVRIMPTAPEQVQLTVDWLLPSDAEITEESRSHMLALGRLVIAQDGRVCELNQQGLRSRRHAHGTLVPQEHALWQFHEWLRSRLAAAVQER
jgi:Rieske 2Fe-2S family protein